MVNGRKEVYQILTTSNGVSLTRNKEVGIQKGRNGNGKERGKEKGGRTSEQDNENKNIIIHVNEHENR